MTHDFTLSTALARPPRWQRVALGACMFLVTATFGFLQPFVPLYLDATGLTRAQIGFVTGLGMGTTLLVQPLLGRLSDRWDARRPLMVALALLAGSAYFGYRAVPDATSPALLSLVPLIFLALSAAGANGSSYLNVVGGVLVGRMTAGAGRGAGAAYARYRVWGSVGYIVVALLTGWLVSQGAGPRAGLSRTQLDPVFAWGPVLFLAIAFVSLLVPDRRSAAVPTSTTIAPLPAITTSMTEIGAGALANFRRFLFAFFLYQFALYGASAYLSLYLKTLGASSLTITATFAAGVVCEVLVMTQVGRLTDIYGRRPALAIAFLLMPLRLLLYVPATGPSWVLAVQTLHGLNFGIMGTIAVAFVNDVAEAAGAETSRGALQARLGAVGGLAVAISPIVCGQIAQRFGIGAMFAAMALVGAAGAWVFLTQVRESHSGAVSPAERGPRRLRPALRWLAGDG